MKIMVARDQCDGHTSGYLVLRDGKPLAFVRYSHSYGFDLAKRIAINPRLLASQASKRVQRIAGVKVDDLRTCDLLGEYIDLPAHLMFPLLFPLNHVGAKTSMPKREDFYRLTILWEVGHHEVRCSLLSHSAASPEFLPPWLREEQAKKSGTLSKRITQSLASKTSVATSAKRAA